MEGNKATTKPTCLLPLVPYKDKTAQGAMWDLSEALRAGSCAWAPLTKSSPSSSQMKPGLTHFCHACMPALDVAPEKGGIHEGLVTQVALHRRKAIGSARLDPLDSMEISCSETLPLQGVRATSEIIRI